MTEYLAFEHLRENPGSKEVAAFELEALIKITTSKSNVEPIQCKKEKQFLRNFTCEEVEGDPHLVICPRVEGPVLYEVEFSKKSRGPKEKRLETPTLN